MLQNRKWILPIAMAAVLIAASVTVVFAQQGDANPSQTQIGDASGESSTITVQGMGTVSANPDWSVVHLGVESEGKTVEEAQTSAAKAIEGIKTAVLKQGVEQDHIHTSHFNVQPNYHYSETGRELRGYIVTHMLQIEYSDLENVGQVIDAATENGANRVDHVQFTLKDEQALEAQALKKAVEHAKMKAEALAEASGKTIVDIQHIAEGQAQTYMPRNVIGKEMALSDSAGTSLEVGDVEVHQSIGVTFIVR